MGAYGLGLLAAFASQFNNTRTLFFTVWLLGLASLALSWRLRIVVALFGAALLFFYADHSGQALGRVFKRVLAQLGNAAYATFLSHFALWWSLVPFGTLHTCKGSCGRSPWWCCAGSPPRLGVGCSIAWWSLL